MLMGSIALSLGGCVATGSDSESASSTQAVSSAAITSAVASTGRLEEARKLDESRKPTEVLVYLGLEPGMDAADLISGTGYWAEIMARAVGPKGSVVALEPEEFYNDPESKAAWTALIAKTPGLTLTRYPFKDFAYPANSFDFAIINLSYHDLYWESERFKIPRTDPDAYLRGLYAAMRPGAVVGVIDHVGNPGMETRALVDKLHRIDPAVVRADFTGAGFRLAGESDLLANPADDHTVNVFAPAIRGKTDRFLFKFVKPK